MTDETIPPALTPKEWAFPPFGFDADHVRLLRRLAAHASRVDGALLREIDGALLLELDELADRIAALLPPAP